MGLHFIFLLRKYSKSLYS